MPLIQIRNKDRVSKKVLPLPMERLPLAIISELGGEYGLDVFWLGGEDTSTASGGSFNGVAVSFGMGKEAVPDFEVLVVDCAADGAGNEVNICRELSLWIFESMRGYLPPGSHVLTL
jgi:hypothetical protein